MREDPPPSKGRRLGRGWVAVLIAAAILAGCSERERLNPLDPKNGSTGGLIAGFAALAGDRQVEIRWTRLTQPDVASYGLLRWRPGGAPSYIGETYGKNIAGTVDSTVVNDETYIYRLVAFFLSGDSAVSPADSATPGTRKIVALSAGVPGLVGLTPDARQILYVQASPEAYEDMEVDRVHSALWLTAPDAGLILRKLFDGRPAGPTIAYPHPSDVSVSNNRGLGWVASPDQQAVRGYGPDLTTVDPFREITSQGNCRVVEAGTLDQTVWIGNDAGFIRRFDPALNGPLLNGWFLDAPVVAIALDEAAERAWVAVHTAIGDDLYVLDGRDSTSTKTPGRWSDIADLAFDSVSHTLWISERGIPHAGNGRLTRVSASGAVLAFVGNIEPFGIMADPVSGNCWASDVKSGRLLEISPDGAVLRESARIDVPYGVRVLGGSGAP